MEKNYKWEIFEVVDFWEAFPRFEATEQVKNKIAKICAWCPDKEQKDHLALQKWYKLTHTVCPECAEQEISRVKEKFWNILKK